MNTMHPDRGACADVGASLDELLRGDGLYCVYQPFVDLDSGSVLAFEALLRGPAGTGWASPLALLDAARAAGRLADLERASLRTSLAAAAEMSGGRPVTLLVNMEPSTRDRRRAVPAVRAP